MDVVAASLVAVLGTLLGATLTHLFQRRTELRAEQFTRSERLRQERIDAYCAYGGALANYRRGQMDYWFAKHDGRAVGEESIHELRREAQRLRAAAMEAMFRAELLTDSVELDELGRRALKAVDRIPGAQLRDELDPVREESRSLIYEFIAASRRHIPGLYSGE
ncbi:hypothetical protein [Streptomyces sp. GESEQ-35]|uniref:hypothetical protein n=1 Tax=Streptomyces sp. GESEQ-35 TaxID=2812657 RepID=UPI001B338663|nr:hypothetical protein [Streptomyces sp. GESEQ-35]